MSRRGKGEGSLFQRKDGRWTAQLTLEDGTQKVAYRKTRAEAHKALQQMLRDQEQGILATGPQQTMKHFMEYWLEEVHRPSIRSSSYANYRSILDKHIIPALGHIQVQKLTVQHLQKFYASKLKEGLSPKTVKVYHAVLHNALSHAVYINLVPRNVSDLATKSLPKQTRYEIQPLTMEQAKELLEKVCGHHLETLLILAVTTGMRRGELLALRWQDVDFENKCLQVCRSVRREAKIGLHVNEPKTKAGRRKVVLSPFLVDVLKQHRIQQLEARLQAGAAWEDHGLVFCTKRGRFIDPTYMLVMFKKLLSQIGLPRMRFHDLRHSAATLLLAMGVHVKVVQELLGHSNITTTLGTYAHVLPTMQQDAMNKISNLFNQLDNESVQGNGFDNGDQAT